MPASVLIPIPTLTITAVIDILAVAFVIYQLLEIVRGTRAAHILVGILAVVLTYEIALRTGLEALRSLVEGDGWRVTGDGCKKTTGCRGGFLWLSSWTLHPSPS